MKPETGNQRPGTIRAPRLLLVLLTVAAYANAIPNGFVWIDHWQVEAGGVVAHSWPDLWRLVQAPLGSMPHWEGAAPYARPVVVAVLSLIAWLVGPHPAAYHITLVLLHTANVVLSYGLLRALTVTRGTAFMAAAIFAVHPLQTAAVSWISGIADPLFTLFLLGAWRCQMAASAGRRCARWLRLAAVLSFVGALGAKEAAAVFPLLLIVTYLCFPATLRAPTPAAQRQASERRPCPAGAIGAAVAPFFTVLVGVGLYRLFILRGAAVGVAASPIPVSVRLRTVPRLILSYLTLPLRLGSLSICDDYALALRWDLWTLAAAVALMLLLATLARWRHRFPDIVFGCAWMLLGLVPVLGIVPILHYRADRFFYFPMIGWSVAAASALRRLAAATVGKWGFRRSTTGASMLVLLVLTFLTVRRNALFTDDRTLFEETVRRTPLCREAHTTLGDVYLRAGRYSEAATEYERAREALPGRASYVVMPKVLVNLGMAQLAVANYPAAERAFSEAHRLQPELLHPLFGLGAANLGLGRTATAATWLEKAFTIDGTDPDVVFNLALAYDRLGRASDAARLYQRYLDVTPRGRARALAQERLRILSASSPPASPP